jgi:hypothetical protein
VFQGLAPAAPRHAASPVNRPLQAAGASHRIRFLSLSLSFSHGPFSENGTFDAKRHDAWMDDPNLKKKKKKLLSSHCCFRGNECVNHFIFFGVSFFVPIARSLECSEALP